MDSTLNRRVSLGFSFFAVMTLLMLSACTPTYEDNEAAFRSNAEAYFRANISSLSPRTPTLGGTYRVTKVEWEDDDTALVTYEDGHVQLRARADVTEDDNDMIVVGRFRLDTGSMSSASMSSTSSSTSIDSSHSSSAKSTPAASSLPSAASQGQSTATSAKARAKLGEFCGGIAGVQCEPGLDCQYEGSYPDAGGTCV